MNEGRLAPLLVGQVLVARAHGKSVRLPYRRRRDDAHRQAEVGHHPADDGELLEVLFPEYGDVGLHDMKELRDYRRDALEVSGPELSVEDARESRYLDARRALSAVGIDLGDIGHEHEIAACLGQHARILRRRAGIVGEILVRPELHGIDEEAGDEAVAVAARGLDEA